MLPDAPRCSQTLPDAPRCPQMLPDAAKYSQRPPHAPRCCQMLPNICVWPWARVPLIYIHIWGPWFIRVGEVYKKHFFWNFIESGMFLMFSGVFFWCQSLSIWPGRPWTPYCRSKLLQSIVPTDLFRKDLVDIAINRIGTEFDGLVLISINFNWYYRFELIGALWIDSRGLASPSVDWRSFE